MQTRFIEATNKGEQGNWGKFLVGRFDVEEWNRRSCIGGYYMLPERGWSHQHLLVVDLQTGEGAIFRYGGSASNDLNEKHRIWVCPLFEPFLNWLYQQDLKDLTTLPDSVELPDAPFALSGYRREGREIDHVHHYVFNRHCGAHICNECDDHKGLTRCYCGWSRSGRDGYQELIEMGETIEPDE